MERTFTKLLFNYLPARLLPALTGFILTPWITRLFNPAEYGYWALAAGFSDFLYALACSGIGASVIRFSEAYRLRSQFDDFFASLVASLGLAVVPTVTASLILLFLLRSHIPEALYPLIQIGVLIFACQSIFNLLSNLMIAQQKSRMFTTFQLLNRYGGIAVGLAFVLILGFRIEGLLWGSLLVLALCIPFMLASLARDLGVRISFAKRSNIRKIWCYGFPLAIGNMAMWGLRLSDRYLIGFFRADSEVGIYSAAYNLSGKSIEILGALFSLSMFPILVKVWENEGREATEKALALITRLYLILGIPAVAGLSLFASPFISLFAATAYHEGYRIVGPVAFSAFLWELSLIAGSGLLIHKQTRWIAANQIVASLVNVGLNLLLLPRFGFVAAGITTLAGYLILFFLQYSFSRRYLTWHFPNKSLRNILTATLVMGALSLWVYGLSGDLAELRPGYFFFCLALAVPAYFGALWMLGEWNESERGAAKSFFHRLRAGWA
jgi:O-antigen/teichoic acid export membrane protein